MKVLLLEKDGRCLWLENKVLKGFLPMAVRNSVNPFAKKMYVIIDWISNDYGRVGVDLKWLKSMGVPVAKTINDLPKNEDFKVVNTGYDSIVSEEIILRDRGVDIIDKPCPFVRRVRDLLEHGDQRFQYVLLCEPNHIIVKNFASIFPEDLILLQMENYAQKLAEKVNGKPIKFLPYVTFLESDVDQVFSYIQTNYPDAEHECLRTCCMWVTSKASPIVEINQLSSAQLEGIKDAVLISTAGTTNKSVISMEKTLIDKGLKVHSVGSLKAFLQFERDHKDDHILLVRSPIPNQAEKPILAYIDKGWLAAQWAALAQSLWVKMVLVRAYKAYMFIKYRLNPALSYREAKENGLLTDAASKRANEEG